MNGNKVFIKRKLGHLPELNGEFTKRHFSSWDTKIVRCRQKEWDRTAQMRIRQTHLESASTMRSPGSEPSWPQRNTESGLATRNSPHLSVVLVIVPVVTVIAIVSVCKPFYC